MSDELELTDEGKDGLTKFLSLIVVLFIVVIGLAILNSAINNWYDYQVEMKIVENSTEVAKEIISIFKK